MKKQRVYTLDVDKYEREAILNSLHVRRSERQAEDLPTDVVDGIVKKLDDSPVKRGIFGLGNPKYELQMNSDERREIVGAVTDRRSALLAEGKFADVFGEVLEKVLYAGTRGVSAREAR